MANKITQKDIDNVKADTQREKWGIGETLLASARRHLESISTKSRNVPRYNRNQVNTSWLSVSPEARLEYIRGNLNDATEEALEALDRERESLGIPEAVRRDRDDREEREDKKRGKKNRSKGRKRRRRRRRRTRRERRDRDNNTPQNPNPSEIIEEEPVLLTPPSPRPIESPTPPPPPRKLEWNSRIGYFVSLSDITWYEEVPRTIESPFVDIDFNELPESFLRLREGEIWKSDWYDTGVIRGLNIDVLGKHKLNYSKNGDFEI